MIDRIEILHLHVSKDLVKLMLITKYFAVKTVLHFILRIVKYTTCSNVFRTFGKCSDKRRKNQVTDDGGSGGRIIQVL